MDWIKKRYDQFLLALAAAALLGFAVMVYLKTGGFGEKFSEARSTVTISKQIPQLVLTDVELARTNLTTPPVWTIPRDFEKESRGSLFVSQPYIVSTLGVPQKPINES